MPDLGRPDFEILGGFVIILRQRTERHFQIVLPRLAVVIIGYVMPLFGLELLDIARNAPAL